MAANATIQMNFSRAVSQAEKLEAMAEELRQIADRQLTESMQQLSAGWTGDSASAYLSKGARLAEKIRNHAKQLDDAAAVIRKMAANIYRAEMHNLEIANTRTY